MMRADMDRVLGEHRSSRRGPAYRFLRSQVGRPWNVVFAEICEQCRGRQHTRDEFLRHVERHVERVGEGLHGTGRFGHRKNLFSGELYVCPKTGLLKVMKEHALRRKKEKATKYIRIDGLHQCRVLDGAWHMVTFKRLPPNPRVCREQDVVLNRPVRELDVEQAMRTYGDRVFAVAARKMTEKQLAQYKIVQDP
jgi:hypothetical protein